MITNDGARALAYLTPWLYHVVHRAGEATRETVASDGLAPGPSRRNWHPLWKPRPGHIYLATYGYLTRAPWNLWRQGDDLYSVRTSCLLAARINPDEDQFGANKEAACDQFNLPRPPDHDLWRLFPSVVPSYGDWADQVALGSDPAHTAYSASQGSLAYAGVIPPKALCRWDEANRRWVDGSDANGEQPGR